MTSPFLVAAAIRWVGLMGLATLVGSLVVETFILPGAAHEAAGARRRLQRIGAICLTRAPRRGKDAALVSLALVVFLLGLESAIHSVHHLSDPQAAASCATFSASQHVPGAGGEPSHVGAPTWTTRPAPALRAEPTRPLQAFRSHEGRAPPALPSV